LSYGVWGMAEVGAGVRADKAFRPKMSLVGVEIAVIDVADALSRAEPDFRLEAGRALPSGLDPEGCRAQAAMSGPGSRPRRRQNTRYALKFFFITVRIRSIHTRTGSLDRARLSGSRLLRRSELRDSALLRRP